jgi:hypothetical protein
MSEKATAPGTGDGLPLSETGFPKQTDGLVVNTESPAESTKEEQEIQRDIHAIKWALTVGAVLSCVFLFALDTTVVSWRHVLRLD